MILYIEILWEQNKVYRFDVDFAQYYNFTENPEL